jgi:exopolyphosphatase / guanosine-5'-triphosphate,3'-diphosphate pyrophosphatase
VSSQPATAGAPTAPGAIVPRWEWRTFGESFGEAEERLGAADPDHVHESDEVYLLSALTDASVKVRDELMDVKRLQRVDEHGLQQWLPVLKAPFPLGPDAVSTVSAALGRPAPKLEGSYSLDELLELSEARAVEVHKVRRRYDVAGCAAELTDISAGSEASRTIAVESEDPARVVDAVRSLGLPLQPNTCVARGLKALVGRRFAVIDVGTNSVKFYVADRQAESTWTTVLERSEVTRLGEGLDRTGRLGAEPVRRTVDAVAAMVEEALGLGVDDLAAVGTAGLRIAPNRDELLEAVREHTGIVVEVVPGEEEARLAYLATKAALGLHDEAVVDFDTGGGSSQFTFGHGDRVDEQFSVPVGAVRFTEEFGLDGPVDENRLAAAEDAIAAALEPLDRRRAPDALIGMGGAVTNLAAVQHELAEYDPAVVRGTRLERVEVERQIELYRTRTADERRSIVGLQPKRAEVILAGACIVLTVLRKLDAPSLTVSDRGLRHGLMAERFRRPGR